MDSPPRGYITTSCNAHADANRCQLAKCRDEPHLIDAEIGQRVERGDHAGDGGVPHEAAQRPRLLVLATRAGVARQARAYTCRRVSYLRFTKISSSGGGAMSSWTCSFSCSCGGRRRRGSGLGGGSAHLFLLLLLLVLLLLLALQLLRACTVAPGEQHSADQRSRLRVGLNVLSLSTRGQGSCYMHTLTALVSASPITPVMMARSYRQAVPMQAGRQQQRQASSRSSSVDPRAAADCDPQ